LALDPVCGREITESVINTAVGQVSAGAPEIASGTGTKRYYDGQWWYFCSFQCRQKFLATPGEYAEKARAGGS